MRLWELQSQVQAQRVVERRHQPIGQPAELLADALGIERTNLLGLGLGVPWQATFPAGISTWKG